MTSDVALIVNVGAATRSSASAEPLVVCSLRVAADRRQGARGGGSRRTRTAQLCKAFSYGLHRTFL